MLINDFVERAIEQDGRNIFEKTKLHSDIPEEIRAFYQQANPLDVEITMDGNAVKFVPANELETTQSEYSMGNERFVFATCNGDPIYVYGGRIYTCCHGTGRIKDELMADDFSSFLDLID